LLLSTFSPSSAFLDYGKNPPSKLTLKARWRLLAARDPKAELAEAPPSGLKKIYTSQQKPSGAR